MEFFDGIVVSADIHCIKPSAKIYQYLLERYDLIPEECLFIDDRLENVSGAIEVGMQGYQFKNDFEELRKMC